MSKSLPACGVANSILEPELRDAALQGIVTGAEILETHVVGRRTDADAAPSYFLTVRMRWSGGKVWYLTTRRHRGRPRLFRQLTALLELLRDIAPDPITLRRDVPLPNPSASRDARSEHAPRGE